MSTDAAELDWQRALNGLVRRWRISGIANAATTDRIKPPIRALSSLFLTSAPPAASRSPDGGP